MSDTSHIRAIAREEAKGSVRRYAKGSLIGFMLLLVGIGAGRYSDNQHAAESRDAIVNSGRGVATAGCNRDFRTQYRLRQIIKRSNGTLRQLHKEGTITKAQLQRYLKSNRTALKDLPLPDCRVARESVTADPSDKRQIPKPLYPKS